MPERWGVVECGECSSSLYRQLQFDVKKPQTLGTHHLIPRWEYILYFTGSVQYCRVSMSEFFCIRASVSFGNAILGVVDSCSSP